MSKKIGNIYDKAIDFYKLKEAYERTSKRKKKKKERIYYGMYLEDNIYKIGISLKQRTYEVGTYMCIAKRKWESPYILKYDIKKFLNEKLQLDLNKKTSYFPLKNGVIFCGYKIYTTHKLLKRANIQRMKKRIKNWNKKYTLNTNKIDEIKKWQQSFFAWKGYAKEAEKYNLYKSLEKKCKWIDTEHN